MNVLYILHILGDFESPLGRLSDFSSGSRNQMVPWLRVGCGGNMMYWWLAAAASVRKLRQFRHILIVHIKDLAYPIGAHWQDFQYISTSIYSKKLFDGTFPFTIHIMYVYTLN